MVNTWVENPYWQFFTGETYLQLKSPIDPSSLTRWRKRIGEEGVETLLLVTIPDVLDRVEFWRVGRQAEQVDVFWRLNRLLKYHPSMSTPEPVQTL